MPLCILFIFLIIPIHKVFAAQPLTEFPFSILWQYVIPIQFSDAPATLSSASTYCFPLDSQLISGKTRSDYQDVWFTYKYIPEQRWLVPYQSFTSQTGQLCFRTTFNIPNTTVMGVIFGYSKAPKAPVLQVGSPITLQTLAQSSYTAETQPALGDEGMRSNVIRENMQMIKASQNQAYANFDCYNTAGPAGPGPNGNLVTEQENTNLAGSQVLTIAEKCRVRAHPPGQSVDDWFHWSSSIIGTTTLGHTWSSKDGNGVVTGGLTGTWAGGLGSFNTSWTQAPNSPRVYRVDYAAGNAWLNADAPKAEDYRQIMQNRWINTQSFLWSFDFNILALPPNSASRYLLSIPLLSSCWGNDGKPCGTSSSPTIRFFGFTPTKTKPSGAHCSPLNSQTLSVCPPYHEKITGEKISRGTAGFPYDAYLQWTGGTDVTTGTGQDIYQILPHPEWEPYGFPTQLIGTGNASYTFDIEAITRHLPWTTPQPSESHWTLSVETESWENTHVIYETSKWTTKRPTGNLIQVSASSATPTPTPSPSNLGYFDLPNCRNITGWACNSASNNPVQVKIFSGDGAAQQLVSTLTAQEPSENAVDTLCGSANHRFTIPIPDRLKTNTNQTIHGFGINAQGAQYELKQSPMTLNCAPSAPTTIPGDINRDGKVDIFDYNLLVAEFGKTGTLVSDINGDGKVDIFDYNILVTNFGKTN